MANQYVNKVVQADGTVLMDISDTTATANTILQGYTAYGKNGQKITGTATTGITPAGTISIDDEGTYDVTNYASADVDIDYSSKVREITFVINRQDTSSSRVFSIYGTFGSTLDFSQGINSNTSSTIIAAGESTKSYTIHCPKQRPIIVVGAIQAVGNYDVTIDSSYGECVDVPHILGSTNTAFTKAIYLKAAAPDALTITITFGSQAAYPESVVTSPLSVTANGTYTASSGTAYSEITVNVPSSSVTPTLQDKTATPTESSQTITADTGYDGLSSVTVGAISSTYVGTGITRRSSSNLTASGATVTAPAGYYAEAASKSVASGSATTPATTVTANPTISVSSSGLITATASASQNVTPTVSAGYVSSGTAGTITVSGSKTQQLTTVAATTYNTSTTDQTIPSGRYTTGTQTIKAVTVSGLSAANIASGVTVKVGDANDDDRIASVTGTLAFVTYYTGSSNPSSSTGSNGDIYLKTVG